AAEGFLAEQFVGVFMGPLIAMGAVGELSGVIADGINVSKDYLNGLANSPDAKDSNAREDFFIRAANGVQEKLVGTLEQAANEFLANVDRIDLLRRQCAGDDEDDEGRGKPIDVTEIACITELRSARGGVAELQKIVEKYYPEGRFPPASILKLVEQLLRGSRPELPRPETVAQPPGGRGGVETSSEPPSGEPPGGDEPTPMDEPIEEPQTCPPGFQAIWAERQIETGPWERYLAGCEKIEDPSLEDTVEAGWEEEWENLYAEAGGEVDGEPEPEEPEQSWDEWKRGGYQLPNQKFPHLDFGAPEWRQWSWAEAIAMSRTLRENLLNIYSTMTMLREQVERRENEIFGPSGIMTKLSRDRLADPAVFSKAQSDAANAVGEIHFSVSGVLRFLDDGSGVLVVRSVADLENAYATLQKIRSDIATRVHAMHLAEAGRLKNEYEQALKKYSEEYAKNEKWIVVINGNLESILPASQGQIAAGMKHPAIERIESKAFETREASLDEQIDFLAELDRRIAEFPAMLQAIRADQAKVMALMEPVRSRIDQIRSMTSALERSEWPALQAIYRELGHAGSEDDDFLDARIAKLKPLLRIGNAKNGYRVTMESLMKMRDILDARRDLAATTAEPLRVAIVKACARDLEKLAEKISQAATTEELDRLSNQANAILARPWANSNREAIEKPLNRIQDEKLKRLSTLAHVTVPVMNERTGSLPAGTRQVLLELALLEAEVRQLIPGYDEPTRAKSAVERAAALLRKHDALTDPAALALYSAIRSRAAWLTGEALPILDKDNTTSPGGESRPASGALSIKREERIIAVPATPEAQAPPRTTAPSFPVDVEQLWNRVTNEEQPRMTVLIVSLEQASYRALYDQFVRTLKQMNAIEKTTGSVEEITAPGNLRMPETEEELNRVVALIDEFLAKRQRIIADVDELTEVLAGLDEFFRKVDAPSVKRAADYYRDRIESLRALAARARKVLEPLRKDLEIRGKDGA
ncbi:MAG: hypothetical protein AAB229_06965, partial [Candidatus Hydrogenedentota bacterium]